MRIESSTLTGDMSVEAIEHLLAIVVSSLYLNIGRLFEFFLSFGRPPYESVPCTVGLCCRDVLGGDVIRGTFGPTVSRSRLIGTVQPPRASKTWALRFLLHGQRRDSSVYQKKRIARDSCASGSLLSATSDRGINFQHDGVCVYASILERSVFRDLILFYWCPQSKSCSSFRQVRPRT